MLTFKNFQEFGKEIHKITKNYKLVNLRFSKLNLSKIINLIMI